MGHVVFLKRPYKLYKIKHMNSVVPGTRRNQGNAIVFTSADDPNLPSRPI
jgi:hypothetical protein